MQSGTSTPGRKRGTSGSFSSATRGRQPKTPSRTENSSAAERSSGVTAGSVPGTRGSAAKRQKTTDTSAARSEDELESSQVQFEVEDSDVEGDFEDAVTSVVQVSQTAKISSPDMANIVAKVTASVLAGVQAGLAVPVSNSVLPENISVAEKISVAEINSAGLASRVQGASVVHAWSV